MSDLGLIVCSGLSIPILRVNVYSKILTVLFLTFEHVHSAAHYILSTNACRMAISGGAKVSCILHHRSIQLILAYCWARPVILVAGKDI